MATTSKVRTNVYLDASMKAKAQEIFKIYGLGLSEAFNIFLSQSVMQKGIPFEVKIPNEATLKAIKDVEMKKNVEETTLDELIGELNKVRSA